MAWPTGSRREFLLAASSLSVMAGFGKVLVAAADDPPRCLIDVHCHVFNARDVPAADFVLNIVAREHDLGTPIGNLGALFVALMAYRAPSVGAEQRRLLSERNLDKVALGDDKFRENVAGAIAKLNDGARMTSARSVLDSPVGRTLSLSGAPPEDLVVPADGQAPSPEALALLELQRTYGIAGAPELVSPQVMAPSDLLNAVPAQGGMLSAEEQQRLTDAIVADVAATRSGPTGAATMQQGLIQGVVPQGAVAQAEAPQAGATGSAAGRFIGMARIFLSYRIENIRLLDKTIRRSADTPRIRLYCPALVDFDSWVGVSTDNASTELREQAGLMSMISLRTDADLLVNGYMAFDPLRAAMRRLVRLGGGSEPLFVVRKAVEDLGFIGVKLYPPMGFRPWGNAGANQSYGRFVKRWLDEHHIALGKFEETLDVVLDELYGWCLDRDVPILAHCGNSQTAFDGSGLRADPAGWEALLKRGSSHGRSFANLRLNLAHMGAIWCHVDPAMSAAPGRHPGDEYLRCQAATGWSAKLFEMLAAGGSTPTYPNLYADLADVGAMAIDDSQSSEAKQDGRKKLARVLLDMADRTGQSPRVLSKLLYGTDWMFLAMFANFAGFADGAADLAGRIRTTPDELLWHNAARFLGLVKTKPGGRESATVTRLRRFYRARPDKLESLDALLV